MAQRTPPHAAPSLPGERPTARAKRDPLGRRGVSSVIFALSATVLLGMSALATEGGIWYFSLRNARSAADAAAMAGASTHARYTVAGSTTSGIASATAVATSNGFTHNTASSTVVVRSPPTSGTLNGTAGAYEVVITRTHSTGISRVVTQASPVVHVRAVASPLVLGPACVLSLGGAGSTGLDIGGSSNTVSPGCIFASNLLGSNSIERFGSATLDINTFQSVGGCNGCDSNLVTLHSPIRSYTPPTNDPFVALQNITQPVRNQLNCQTPPDVNGAVVTIYPSHQTGVPGPSGRPVGYCSGNDNNNTVLNMNNGDTLIFLPGVYYFYNTSLIVNGGTVSCPTCVAGSQGVTLIFTGTPDRTGTFSLNGGATFNLMADPSQTDSRYNGVLMYRDVRANTGNASAYTTNINGGSTSTMTGGMYFPSSDITYNGNSTLTSQSCTVLVARSITFSGNVSNTGCTTFGTSPTVTYAIRLVE